MPAQPADAPPVPARAWYVLGVLTLVYITSFVDRQILSILAESIKHDLALTDAQLGFLYGTAFAIFYALFGIPLGRLADGWNRVWLIAAGLVGWSVMTSLSGLATSFAVLAVARVGVGVGVGEASTSPAAYSLIAGHFPERRCATALSIYASGLYVGQGLSLPIGGMLVSWWQGLYPSPASAPLGLAPWQAAFLMIGLPGMAIAPLVLTLRDPDWAARRAAARSPWPGLRSELATVIPPFTLASAARYPGELRTNLAILGVVAAASALLARLTGDAAQWAVYGVGLYAVTSWVRALRHRDAATFRLIWGTPVTVALVATFGGIAFITYSTAFWASPYALRTFYAAPTAPSIVLHGTTALKEVAGLVGWSSAVGSALGVVTGGLVADRWRRRDRRGRLFTVSASVVAATPLTLAMFSTRDAGLFFLLVPLATFTGSAWSGAAIATVNDLVLPRMRATAGATFLLGMTLIGLALGPYLTGKVGAATGNLRNGIFCLYLAVPAILCALWYAGRRLPGLEDTREVRAGGREPERDGVAREATA